MMQTLLIPVIMLGCLWKHGTSCANMQFILEYANRHGKPSTEWNLSDLQKSKKVSSLEMSAKSPIDYAGTILKTSHGVNLHLTQTPALHFSKSRRAGILIVYQLYYLSQNHLYSIVVFPPSINLTFSFSLIVVSQI